MKAFLITLLMLPALLHAEGRDIAYEKINPVLNLEIQSPLLEVKLAVDISDASLPFEEVQIWLVQNDEVVAEIFVDPSDGTIALPTLTEREARRHTLRINQPEELVQISFGVTVLPPPNTAMSYRELFYLVDDANLFIKAMAGAMAFLAPKVDALKFHFAEAATISIESVEEPLTFETERDNSISVKQSSKLMEENPMVVFSIIPVTIEPLK
tara:strand:+ start:292 stop:927 length:636 start_codon:yes stop_codon:yes gene_type:complete